MNYNFSNDRKALYLLEIKAKKQGLTWREKRRLKRLGKLYKHSNKSYSWMIFRDIQPAGYLMDANITGSGIDENGNPYVTRKSDEIDYIVSPKGLEALKNYTFESESEARKWGKMDRRVTRIAAWVGGLGSALLALDRFIPFIEPLVKSIQSILKH